MKIGSLFSGIGGLELGLERSIPGACVVWQVEQDEFCRQVLARHWPDALRFEDVREVGDELPAVDLICGGFPCQGLSYANANAKGLADERSGLWGEFARIVRLLRPRFVVVENVPALLSRGFGTVLGELAASGYSATWDCIPASAVGSPHRRDRIFLVAYANSGELRQPTEQQSVANTEQPAHHGEKRALADAPSGRPSKRQDPGNLWQLAAAVRSGGDAGMWAIEPGMGRVANGVPGRVAKLKALGNAVVPQVAERVGRVVNLLAEAGAGR